MILAISLSAVTLLGGCDVLMPLSRTRTSSAEPTSAIQTAPVAASPVESNLNAAQSSDELIARSYAWEYQGKWTWDLKVPQSLYDYYKNLPRTPTTNYSVYATHPLDNEHIGKLVEKLELAAKEAGFNPYQTVEFAAAFVQSLPYTSDLVTTGFDEYPRYPMETLVDNGGDCEDTSILLASILKGMGYGTVLIMFEDHAAVGVLGGSNIYGTYWEHSGGKYYYIETTGSGWKIGELPDEFKDQGAKIYDLTPVPILTHDFKATGRDIYADLTVTVNNIGTAAASGVYVSAGFDAGGDQAWNVADSDPFTLAPGQSATVNLRLRFPSNKHTRLRVQIVHDGYAVDESYSGWFQTP